MKKILVIEDEPEMRRNLTTILRLEKFYPLPAEDGRVGVELAKREKPDLILCDVASHASLGSQTFGQIWRHRNQIDFPNGSSLLAHLAARICNSGEIASASSPFSGPAYPIS